MLFHEDEIDRKYKAHEGSQMVPLQRLSLEKQMGNDAEDNERYDLLNNLQLHEREEAAIAFETNSIGRHLTAIFEESNGPREGNDANEWPVVANARLLQLKMAVPGKRHKYIAADEQQYGVEGVHKRRLPLFPSFQDGALGVPGVLQC